MHFSDSQLHYRKQMAAGILKALGRVCSFQLNAFHHGLDNIWLIIVTQLHINNSNFSPTTRQFTAIKSEFKVNMVTRQQMCDKYAVALL